MKLEYIIGEFAENESKRDVTVLFSTYSNDINELQKHLASMYLGLFSINGNSEIKPKQGVFPVGDGHSLISFANPTHENVRVIGIFVKDTEVNTVLGLLSNEVVNDALVAIRIALSKEIYNNIEIMSLLKRFDQLLETTTNDNDGLDRVVNIFGSEI